jgi:acyl-lipid omega-6 desaturase (Delta-12 desaturase)
MRPDGNARQRLIGADCIGSMKRYREPSNARALWQLLNTLIPYGLVWVLMSITINFSYWVTLPLALLAAGLLVRLFIIFHDCGHGSFFKSQRGNAALGFMTGVLTFTPYLHWRWQHGIHHGTAGDLDRRGSGDVWTLTVCEYLQSSRSQRLLYRLARNPLLLFLVAPIFYFVIAQRLPSATAPDRERRSVWITNAAILMAGLIAVQVLGWRAYLLIQSTVLVLAGAAGTWLFYVQHQFDGVYWERSAAWDYTAAALQGSSYYKLPAILRWFSGNIGFHHIHHLNPRIPNYYLRECHDAGPAFRLVKPLTLLSSLKCLSFRLWDEGRKQLVGYPQLP